MVEEVEDLSNTFTTITDSNGFCDNSSTFRVKLALKGKKKSEQALIQGLSGMSGLGGSDQTSNTVT